MSARTVRLDVPGSLLVDAVRHRLKMVGVHTTWVPAEVVDFKARRDLAHKDSVGDPVRGL